MTNHSQGPNRRLVVTTSWDDGVEADLKLAEHLARHQLVGTFYVGDVGYRGLSISPSSILALRSMGMEIGAHTVTHPDLRRLTEAQIRVELRGNRERLEDLIGETVSSFCYPYGYFDTRVARLVREEGFTYARTTISHRFSPRVDRLAASVTWQMYPHGPLAYVRHAVRHLNITGALRAISWDHKGGPLAAIESLGESSRDAVIHLWGHSWEIDALGSWSKLDEVLTRLSRLPGAVPRLNRDAYVVGDR